MLGRQHQSKGTTLLWWAAVASCLCLIAASSPNARERRKAKAPALSSDIDWIEWPAENGDMVTQGDSAKLGVPATPTRETSLAPVSKTKESPSDSKSDWIDWPGPKERSVAGPGLGGEDDSEGSKGRDRRALLSSKGKRGGKGRQRRMRDGRWVQGAVQNSVAITSVLAKKKHAKKHISPMPGVDNWYDGCYVARPLRGAGEYSGWRTCANGHYHAGYFRADCDTLQCLVGWKCCMPKNQPQRNWGHCYHENVWSTMDRKGWNGCRRDGYMVSGWFKSGGYGLHNIELFHCCRPSFAEPIDGACYIANWWSSLDRNNGWNICQKPNTFIKKVWRNNCDELHCMEQAQCCTPLYPRPATLSGFKFTSRPIVTLGNLRVNSGRVYPLTKTLEDTRPGRPLRKVEGHVDFLKPFASVPAVHVSVNNFGAQRLASNKVDVFVTKVNPRGFGWRAQTWGDASLRQISVDWVAAGIDPAARARLARLVKHIHLVVRLNRIFKDKLQHRYRSIQIVTQAIQRTHYYTLKKNDELRASRKQIEKQLQAYLAKRNVEMLSIQRERRKVGELRKQTESDMVGFGVVPEETKAIHKFAKGITKWAARTLLHQRSVAHGSTQKVRKDMEEIWHTQNKESDDLDLEILLLESDLQYIKQRRRKWLAEHGCKNCGELQMPDFENLEEKIEDIKKKDGIHGTLDSVQNIEKYGALPSGFWGKEGKQSPENVAAGNSGMLMMSGMSCKCDKPPATTGPRKCVCVHGDHKKPVAPTHQGNQVDAAGQPPMAQPMVFSLLFEEGVAIPPGIRIVPSDEDFPGTSGGNGTGQ